MEHLTCRPRIVLPYSDQPLIEDPGSSVIGEFGLILTNFIRGQPLILRLGRLDVASIELWKCLFQSIVSENNTVESFVKMFPYLVRDADTEDPVSSNVPDGVKIVSGRESGAASTEPLWNELSSSLRMYWWVLVWGKLKYVVVNYKVLSLLFGKFW